MLAEEQCHSSPRKEERGGRGVGGLLASLLLMLHVKRSHDFHMRHNLQFFSSNPFVQCSMPSQA